MPVYRGPDLTAVEMQGAVREAAAECAKCTTITELRAAWRKHVGVGHRALGRMFVAEWKNVEGVALKRSALAKQ